MAGRLAVVGAGLMGSGIVQVAAQAGWDVALRDLDEAAVQRGLSAVHSSLERFVAKGTIPQDVAEAALARITPTTDLDAAADADVVVEAVFEQIEVKHEVFRALDRICKSGAVLATNTSAIPITQIASVTQRPESVIGTHFFSPVPMMKLCELVRGHRTADDTLARAKAFAEGIGKTCIVVNRDVAGFDVLLHATRNIYADTGEGKFFPPELLTRMVAAGDIGRKAGRGFYRYGS